MVVVSWEDITFSAASFPALTLSPNLSKSPFSSTDSDLESPFTLLIPDFIPFPTASIPFDISLLTVSQVFCSVVSETTGCDTFSDFPFLFFTKKIIS